MDAFFLPLERHLNRGLLKSAVMRQIFCPACRNVLDVRRAVLVTHETNGAACICADCFDRTRDHLLSMHPGAEVLDGRDVYKAAPRKRAPRAKAPDAIIVSVHVRFKNGRTRSRRVTAHAVNGAPFYIHRTIGDRTRWTISRACGHVADVAIAQSIKGRDVAARIARRFWEALDENQQHVLSVHPHGAPATDETRAMGEILRRVRREVETPAAAHV